MKQKLVILSIVALSACGRGYSEGDRSGVVSKLSFKGYTWKSWEGQLNLGGMTQQSNGNGGTDMVPNVWEFTVVDSSVIDKIKAAQSSGARVKLHYTQWMVSPCSMDTSYEVTGVE